MKWSRLVPRTERRCCRDCIAISYVRTWAASSVGSAKCLVFWSEWQDLNLRPPRPERGDLRSSEAAGQKENKITDTPRLSRPCSHRVLPRPASRRSQKSNKCGDSALMKRCGRLLGGRRRGAGESGRRANRSGDGEGWGLDRLA